MLFVYNLVMLLSFMIDNCFLIPFCIYRYFVFIDMSARGCNPPQPSLPYGNKRKVVTKKKRPNYVLKIDVPPPTPTPLPSPSPIVVNRPTQLGVDATAISSPSPIVASAPSPLPIGPSTSSVPSPLPVSSPLPMPYGVHHSLIEEGLEVSTNQADVQSNIQEEPIRRADLPMISPQAHG